MFRRPANEKEFQKRQAAGAIRASRFVRKYAHSHLSINVNAFKLIHKEIFKDVWPDIAGRYRTEPVEIADSSHLPPHYSKVSILMNEMEEELGEYTKDLKVAEGFILDIENDSKERYELIDKVLFLAARVHHLITFIHPFREGNGRTARLAANLILERYGLVGLSIKVERSDKDRYRKALAHADKTWDYDPLIDLIVEGIIERYHGVPKKYYA